MISRGSDRETGSGPLRGTRDGLSAVIRFGLIFGSASHVLCSVDLFVIIFGDPTSVSAMYLLSVPCQYTMRFLSHNEILSRASYQPLARRERSQNYGHHIV